MVGSVSRSTSGGGRGIQSFLIRFLQWKDVDPGYCPLGSWVILKSHLGEWSSCFPP